MFEERLLNVNEVSHRLGICKTTARRWADSGKLRTKIISDRGDRRYYLSSVLELMGLRDSKHRDEEKVEIKTIEDGIIYLINTFRFKPNPQGLMNVANTVEENYGFKNSEIRKKIHEMLDEKRIGFELTGKNACIKITKGSEIYE